MKKTFSLAVLLCLHTPALAAEPGPPAPLVEAIARQESGLNPLALNIAGKSYHPATNERWGKWILAEEIARHCLNWKAVGKYHSPDPERGRQYAWLVYRHYAGLRASTPKVEAPHAEQKAHTQNLPDSRGTRADQGIGQQSEVVPLHVQQKGVPWVFRSKSGASGGTD